MNLSANFDRRRRLFLGLVLSTGLVGLVLLFMALAATGVSLLASLPLTLLFALTFTWIAVSFWHAVIGFGLSLSGRDPYSLRRPPEPQPGLASHRTALVMPIYNEDPAAVRAGLAAMARSLLADGPADGFAIFVLSDTRDADILAAEQATLAGLQRELGSALPLHYRHRANNHGRKAGNLADFCRRWGRRYEFMLVLDADSRMDGSAICRLVARMQSDPAIGLIQTVPLPAGQHSLFARLMQFASAVYSPMLAKGQAFWQGPVGNYWGHNALIRVSAFMACCGLPILPGRAPLGGEIMSHDFVEAALLARAGWSVVLETAPLASHEEVPANLLDYAARDRRWMQGNLQHLGLLKVAGLQPASRLHFLFGAAAYLSSLAWLGLLVLGIVTIVLTPKASAEGGDAAGSPWGLIMLLVTVVLLFGPRLLGVGLALMQRAPEFGGRLRLLLSALLEIAAGILLAPVMMLFHARFALEIVLGTSIGWVSPPRGARAVGLGEALRRTGLICLTGLVWLLLAAWLAPQFLWWMSPVWLGLLLAPVMVCLFGSQRLGQFLRAAGLLLTAQERGQVDLYQDGVPAPVLGKGTARPNRPPPERPGPMPIQWLGSDRCHSAPELARGRA
ncbi:MAG: glucans biosynthesis glucosyltransferase MdoH [Wenzhouxiangella sp.]